jgi:hypothetical protein
MKFCCAFLRAVIDEVLLCCGVHCRCPVVLTPVVHMRACVPCRRPPPLSMTSSVSTISYDIRLDVEIHKDTVQVVRACVLRCEHAVCLFARTCRAVVRTARRCNLSSPSSPSSPSPPTISPNQ